MIGVNGAKTPMPTKVNLDLDPNGKDVDQKLYRSMIGPCFTFAHLDWT
jgi:hypothetical protein